jgi:hypothetical protein
MDYVGREVQECQLLEEAIDPDGIEGFGHVEEYCACLPLFANALLFFKRGVPSAATCCVWV